MIKLENVSFKYSDGTPALNNVSLNISAGETLAVIGSNGAGKSTLLKTLVGINTPNSGNIEVCSLKLNKNNLDTIRKKIGIVFQNPDEQLFMTKVIDDISFAPKNHQVEQTVLNERVNQVMEMLNISYLKDRKTHKLSGGEKRLVSIASVLTMNPNILLLDEPATFLDSKSRRTLINILSKLNLTKVISTHDLDMALEISTKVAVLNKGEIIAYGNTSDILHDKELLESCNLELPLSLQNFS